MAVRQFDLAIIFPIIDCLGDETLSTHYSVRLNSGTANASVTTANIDR